MGEVICIRTGRTLLPDPEQFEAFCRRELKSRIRHHTRYLERGVYSHGGRKGQPYDAETLEWRHWQLRWARAKLAELAEDAREGL